MRYSVFLLFIFLLSGCGGTSTPVALEPDSAPNEPTNPSPDLKPDPSPDLKPEVKPEPERPYPPQSIAVQSGKESTLALNFIDSNAPQNIKIAQQARHGGVKINSSNQIVYQSMPFYAGDDFVSLTYELGNKAYLAEVNLNISQSSEAPNIEDPLYTQQWHLNSTGSQTAFSETPAEIDTDIRLKQLHEENITGQGVKVAVIDTGLEVAHVDLKDNILPFRSFNFLTQTDNPTPLETHFGDHGTAVAGIISARASNGVGGRGVAPNSYLMGFNWLSSQKAQDWLAINGGDKTADALVINKSFGYTAIGVESFNNPWNAMSEAHLAKITRVNNNGRGVLLVKSAGGSFEVVVVNDLDNIQYNNQILHAIAPAAEAMLAGLTASVVGIEPETSSFYHTTVAATNSFTEGQGVGPKASYSSAGPAIWISAPGGEYGYNSPGIITTDLMGCERGYTLENPLHEFDNNKNGSNPNCNYSATFQGTSAAAPIISGVAALLWQANPGLTWRDIRHIFVKTARKIDKDSSKIIFTNNEVSITADSGWVTNKAGYHFNNKYGFGLVDASAAVTMANKNSYSLLPELQETGFLDTNISSKNILEGGLGTFVNVVQPNEMIVEGIQLKLNIKHSRVADISIEVTSPLGTRFMALQPRSLLIEDQLDGSTSTGFKDTVLLVNAFYGENAKGEWKVRINDTNSGDFTFRHRPKGGTNWETITVPNNDTEGTIENVQLKIYGHVPNEE